MKVQYDEKTDAIIYNLDSTDKFTREDWVRLACAALDQAGLSLTAQFEVQRINDKEYRDSLRADALSP